MYASSTEEPQMTVVRTQNVPPRGTHAERARRLISVNHNETLVRRQFGVNATEKRARRMISLNHNETLIRR
jgi:hypothetical protein